MAPKLEFKKVEGLSVDQQAELKRLLKARSKELADTGSVMVIELVQIVEDFLAEHNQDPTMSAWEQMQAREEQERIKREEDEKRHWGTHGSGVVSPLSSSRTRLSFTHLESEGISPGPTVACTDLERELLRQREALAAARKGPPSSTTAEDTLNEDDDDDSDLDFDDDYDLEGGYQLTQSTSRYQSDFIELGKLGRGGGGEVVKVRNRLDRRIYAIKKILLESERGRFSEYAAIQNRKLRREVTTISRMTHKNVVRYYQAWVENRDDHSIKEEDPSGPVAPSLKGCTDDESSKEPESESKLSDGMWASHSGGGVSSKYGDEEWDQISNVGSPDQKAMSKLLEQDNDFDFQSPLLTGLGFQDHIYDGLFQSKQTKPQESTDDIEQSCEWDDSSVKIGTGCGKTILYIQMEYCSTTLRKLIDTGAMKTMEENDKWRLIRQLLEALVYIHGQNIIHRDLKPGNVFLDGEGNIRLGDFGLATRHRSKASDSSDRPHDAPDDIRSLMGGAAIEQLNTAETSGESMTGGVGTTFYRAPEQEGRTSASAAQGDSSYTVQADIFSLGIILFEMFYPPFPTYMERADTLTRLRGDGGRFVEEKPEDRFPESFVTTTPENAQW